MTSRLPADVAIIGGGVIGLAVARELACAGATVTVLERDAAGRGATWAAGGMLAPATESRTAGPFTELALASFRQFPAFVTALAAESGLAIPYRDDGKLTVALDEAASASLRQTCTWQRSAGFDVTWLDAAGARAAEPLLADAVRAGVLIRDDHQVDPRALVQALARAASRAGVRVRERARVTEIERVGGRVVAVRLNGEERLSCGVAVLAAGAWSDAVGGLPRRVPIVPVRGDMLALRAAVPPRRVVGNETCYVIPRAAGRVVVGATVMRGESDATPRQAEVAGLVAAAGRFLPALLDAPVVEMWAGVRPGTPDDAPILGPDPDVAGLYYATGHFRNGILLAPITAQLLAAAVMGGSPGRELSAFSVARFDAVT